MLVRKMVIARIYPSLDVSVLTSSLSVKIAGNWFLVATIMIAQIIPSTPAFTKLTTIEHFAALGFPAPNSLDTLTLQEYHKMKKIP